MRFTPKSKEELEFENLLPKGEYDFEVVKAEDAVSKKGNEMIKLNLKVFNGDGFQFVTDYLMEAMAFKLRHFFETVGMIASYEAGTVDAADLVGCAGKVRIDIEPASGDYASKNVVKDYVSKAKKDAGKSSFVSQAQEDDEADNNQQIPF